MFFMELVTLNFIVLNLCLCCFNIIFFITILMQFNPIYWKNIPNAYDFQFMPNYTFDKDINLGLSIFVKVSKKYQLMHMKVTYRWYWSEWRLLIRNDLLGASCLSTIHTFAKWNLIQEDCSRALSLLWWQWRVINVITLLWLSIYIISFIFRLVEWFSSCLIVHWSNSRLY
jgi:hypothetical protein